MSQQMHELTAKYVGEAVQNRRFLHMHPELSFQEKDTADWIRKKLTDYGIELINKYSGYSVVGILRGEKEGPVIAFRAEMDALPIQEETGLPFCSCNRGVMHACGHDAHVSTLVAMARLFSEHRELLRGAIKFIFQSAEEMPPGGAIALCEEGVMDDVDAIFCYHIDSMDEIGNVSLCQGAATAAVGTYEAEIIGKGGHGGMQYTTNNPIICAAAVVQAVNQITALKVNPMEPAVISSAYIISGSAKVKNIIPESVRIGGNIRSYDIDVQRYLYKEIEQTIEKVSAAYGCSTSVRIEQAYPCTINDEKAVRAMEEAVRDMGLVISSRKPIIAGEDFSYYSMKKPACHVMVGFYDPSGKVPKISHHSERLIIDDEHGIAIALELLSTCYLKAVESRRRGGDWFGK